MIATLMGVVGDKQIAGSIILDVHGVGYGVLMPSSDIATISAGEEVKLHIYEHIRENSFDLYGFISTDTKRLFEQLLDVKGVGPKVALGILGIGSPSVVRAAIAGGDVKRIQSAPGVGKRGAERIIIELKDKFDIVASASADDVLLSESEAQKDEAVQALVALGYDTVDAVRALQGVGKDLSTETRVKQALKDSAL